MILKESELEVSYDVGANNQGLIIMFSPNRPSSSAILDMSLASRIVSGLIRQEGIAIGLYHGSIIMIITITNNNNNDTI